MSISRNGVICVSFKIASVPGLGFLNYTKKILRSCIPHFSINRKPTCKKTQISATDLKGAMLSL